MIGLAFIIGETKLRHTTIIHNQQKNPPILTMIIADGFIHSRQRALLGLLLLSITLAARITSRPAVAVFAWTPTTRHFSSRRERIHSSIPEYLSRRVALSSTSDPPASTTGPTERIGSTTNDPRLQVGLMTERQLLHLEYPKIRPPSIRMFKLFLAVTKLTASAMVATR
jgi:hypothetical protein